MTRDEILRVRRERFLPSATCFFNEPIQVARASMQWVWDHAGRKYLDAFGGIVTISAGHNHPRIREKLLAWMESEGPQHTSTLYLTAPAAELAEKLAGIAPGSLRRVCFTNSGSEANEMAILLARQTTKRHEIVALRHAYHGGTAGTLSLVAQGTWKWGGPGVPGVSHAVAPNCYRCPWGKSPVRCDFECAKDLEETVQTCTAGGPAAVIVEPIQGVAGFVVAPDEYLRRVAEITRRYGGLLIVDEVQTGLGRTGQYWFGVQHSGVAPDIITMAKSLGNGAPIGAMLCRDEIAESIRGRKQINTFAAGPWQSLQALETIGILEELGALQKNHDLGERLLAGLRVLAEEFVIIGDVRGRGLMCAIELVEDRETKAPAAQATSRLLEEMKVQGVLVGRGGLLENVIRISPPMCIDAADIDQILAALRESLLRVSRS